MAGRKRSADDTGAAPRAKNARKSSPDATRKGSKKGPKAIAVSAFKARALPLHVNVTHTPPTIPDDESVPAATADPGFLGAVVLSPSSFATGSYGWKGQKRFTIELPSPEGGDGAEKVHVMLTINATVMGSKQAKEADGEDEAGVEGEPAEVQEETKETEAQEEVKEAEAPADAAPEMETAE
ncbi:hypothetical protein BV25DRAFT_1917337 [Artomyces pyxidatus]|uniref:Uncharacterized protein n=1 Tax=Artomyces pyxidatus TaxID=48021 RepID=A0ACB8SWA3_9AGAM|nr:hypothetical protein BV25DRAFT_1917337 [Artomyces pyxidatus]